MSESSSEDVRPPAEGEAAPAEPPSFEGPRGLLRRGSPVAGPAKRWVVLAVVGVGLIAAGWWITKSPLFAARHIEVSGTSHLSRARVIELAGVGSGTNVFWLHTDAVRRRLELDPWVAEADVTRSLPSTISIRIVERQAVAAVPDGKGYQIVALDGTVLGEVSKESALPHLVVDPTAHGALVSTARVAGGMGDWLRGRVKTIAQTSGGIVAQLESGVRVLYGNASSAPAKSRAATAVLQWALERDKQLVSIDVRAPLAPTAQLPYTPPVPVPAASPSPSGKGKTSASPAPSPSPSPAASPTKTTAKRQRRHDGN